MASGRSLEGLAAIANVQETRKLLELAEQSEKFIKRLPWVGGDAAVNSGKGHSEKDLFEPPDFSSIHGESQSRSLREEFADACLNAALAYCSSIVFPGINLPNVSCTLLCTILMPTLTTGNQVQWHPPEEQLQKRHHCQPYGCRKQPSSCQSLHRPL